MKLPHVSEAAYRISDGKDSALDRFIYHQQPAGTALVDFRRQLQATLDEIENYHEKRMALMRLMAEQDSRAVWVASSLAMVFTLAMIVGWVLWGGC